ncbi:hypothetical protein GF412_03105 [Candidatus Micrarchaeota archaeon]|nr:hypothetical protein [Candidatus Micrarchaeota archaeon]MBD3417941.1 hypothetical protein [Candidatus Micrarchaeota archaeon]
MALWVAKKEPVIPENGRKNPMQKQYPLVERNPGYTKPMRVFMRAVNGGKDGDVKALIKSREVDPDGQGKYGDTALMIVAAKGYTRTAGALLENGADPNARGRHFVTPLMVAVKWSMSPKMIEMLIDHGARIRARNLMLETALEEARWAKWLDGCPETRKLLEQKWVEEGVLHRMGRFLSSRFSGTGADA